MKKSARIERLGGLGMGEIRWERLASIVICVAAGGVALWYGGKLLLSLLLPFLLGWCVALCITPIALRLSSRLHVSQKLCSVLLLVLFLSAILLGLGASVSRLLRELQSLLSRLLEGEWLGGEGGFDLFSRMTFGERLSERFGNAERYAAFRERFNEMVQEALEGMLASLSAELPQVMARIVAAMPSILLFVAITVISGFYFCLDRKRIEQAALSLIPTRVRVRLPQWKERVRHFSWRYVRAYLILLSLTFGELFLGFTVLRVEYAFLIALVAAAVDILPVLGVGIVLVPWAIVELLRRNFAMGVGLLVLYLAVSVVRQIVEPRLVGQSLGLHPLLALASGYVGWRLFGVLGMALGPVLFLILKNLLRPFWRDYTAHAETGKKGA